MRDDSWAPYGAAAGAIAMVLFVAGALIIGDLPDFEASGAEVAAHLDAHRTRIQIGCAVLAAATPFLVWFLATVASLTRAGGPGTRRAGTVAYGCGAIFIALFLADVTSLAVGALRPENMARGPRARGRPARLRVPRDGNGGAHGGRDARRLRGHRPSGTERSGRDGSAGSRQSRRPPTPLRTGTLFTTEGPFAADGVLGLYVPVTALVGWILIASVVLAGRLRSDGSRRS